MSFFRVFTVELSKLYRQKRLYIFLLLPILFTTLLCLWNKQSNVRPMLSPEVSMQMLNNLLPFLGFFFMIMVASYLIAEDYDAGTLKLLLLRPVSRISLFNAKVAALLSAILSFYALFLAMCFLIPMIFFGTQQTVQFTDNYQIPEFTGMTMSWDESVRFIALCYLLSSAGAFVLGSILLFFSTAAAKPSVAITFSVILFVACYIWMMVFRSTAMMKFSPWNFMNLFIPYFIEKNGTDQWVLGTFTEYVQLMGIYLGISYLLSILIFRRRDILK